MKRSLVAVASSLVLCGSAFATAEDYVVDTEHTTIEFEVAHLVVSTVRGKFMKFGGDIKGLDTSNLETANLNAWVETNSIDTGIKKRDDHLRSPDFFDAKKFPKITLVSKKVTKTSEKKFTLASDLTIHGTTKEVNFDCDYRGNVNAWGKERAAFRCKSTINRQDFGVKFAAVADQKVVVGDDVDIIVTVEAVRAKDMEPTPAAKPAKKGK